VAVAARIRRFEPIESALIAPRRRGTAQAASHPASAYGSLDCWRDIRSAQLRGERGGRLLSLRQVRG